MKILIAFMDGMVRIFDFTEDQQSEMNCSSFSFTTGRMYRYSRKINL